MHQVPYQRCINCRIDTFLCVCEHIKPFRIASHISLIVHVRELTLSTNSAAFIEKLLPHNSTFSVRGKQDVPFQFVERAERPLFLYPHEDAVELNAEFVKDNPGPYHIIIPDGNWHQARRVRKREEVFKNIPAVKLPPGLVTEYRLRVAPRPEWLSTYEAVAHALGILEGEQTRDRLMTFVRIWVENAIWHRRFDRKTQT
jgi:DTW domain-containing protein